MNLAAKLVEALCDGECDCATYAAAYHAHFFKAIHLGGAAQGAAEIGYVVALVFGVQLQILPIIGLKGPLNYIMPTVALSLYPISMVSRLVRSSMSEAVKQDYMVLARSKGTAPFWVIVKHGLKNCLIPVVTYAGPLVAYLMTGSFVIESLFSIPGLGGEFVTSVTNRDYTLIMALTIFFGALIIIANILTDLLSALIDPRIKLEKGKTAA